MNKLALSTQETTPTGLLLESAGVFQEIVTESHKHGFALSESDFVSKQNVRLQHQQTIIKSLIGYFPNPNEEIVEGLCYFGILNQAFLEGYWRSANSPKNSENPFRAFGIIHPEIKDRVQVALAIGLGCELENFRPKVPEFSIIQVDRGLQRFASVKEFEIAQTATKLGIEFSSLNTKIMTLIPESVLKKSSEISHEKPKSVTEIVQQKQDALSILRFVAAHERSRS